MGNLLHNLEGYILFTTGVFFAILLRNISQIVKKKSITKDKIKQFKEVIDNIKGGKSVFISRINHTVMVDTKVKDYGIVNIVYLMDKKVVCIFKDSKCMHTTEGLDDIGKELQSAIMSNYGHMIEDVVQVLGVTISKEELEQQLKYLEDNIQDLKGLEDLKNNIKEKSDVDKIIEKNESLLDVDSILDKINRVGINKLTKEELDFLNKQSKK
jgi:hypothetical protein